MWQINQTFEQICQLYGSYIEKKFGINVIIVFNGYTENLRSTKNAERNRRSKNTSAEILFYEKMVLTVAQNAFLSNVQNKIRFIKMLSTYLKNNGYTVIQAVDDADTNIIKEAIS